MVNQLYVMVFPAIIFVTHTGLNHKRALSTRTIKNENKKCPKQRKGIDSRLNTALNLDGLILYLVWVYS